MSRTLVIKFGGTSLASATRVVRAARRVRAHVDRGRRVVAVVSAAGRTTDRILGQVGAVAAPGSRGGPAPGPRLLPAHGREVDRALATGEDLSGSLVALALMALGIPSRSLTGGEAGLVAEGGFGRGRIASSAVEPLRRLLEDGVVPVVSGFQADRSDGETLTLGRGGSDVTAVSLAAALGAECHIVTDVAGVCDRDPNLHADARLFGSLDHDQLLALVDRGEQPDDGTGQVVHAAAARLAAEAAVPLRVYHFRAPPARPGGTRIDQPLARAAGGAS